MHPAHWRGRAARNRPSLRRLRRERAHRSSAPRRPVGSGTGDEARTPRGRRPSASVGGAGVRLSLRSMQQDCATFEITTMKAPQSGHLPTTVDRAIRTHRPTRTVRTIREIRGEHERAGRRAHIGVTTGGSSVPRPPGNGPPGRKRWRSDSGRCDPQGPGCHRQACRRGVAGAVHETRHRRSPVHPGDAATAGDGRTVCDGRCHPTAGPCFRSIRLDRRLQAVARRGPLLLGRWPGSRPW